MDEEKSQPIRTLLLFFSLSLSPTHTKFQHQPKIQLHLFSPSPFALFPYSLSSSVALLLHTICILIQDSSGSGA
ncbi:hypothetical protein RJT34_14539 [Clitoria ternatea]|uniref:Uncharacterized protein n=1 Tax=Clitoria ternatea TaxID=43366 RepID=A0AAN9JT30_CLITE